MDHFDDARAGVLAALTNQYRAEKNIKPYSPNANLTTAARDWARFMALNTWNAHEGPDGSTVQTRIEKAGYRNWETYSENYVFSYAPTEQSAWSATQMMEWWKGSSSHNANLLNQTFTEYGSGCYAAKLSDGLVWIYCVMVFAKPR